MAKKKSESLAKPNVLRLSEYLLILENFAKNQVNIISSKNLAETYGNTPIQVRQDIFRLKNTGRVGQGYSTTGLAKAIRHALGLSKVKNLCIIGIGNLGEALATHVPFHNFGMNLSVLFDVHKDLIGNKINGIVVQNIKHLKNEVKKHKINLAALCVPSSEAQKICNELIEAGVVGIMNYTRTHLKTPSHVTVQNQQMVCSFMQLSYATNIGK